MALHPWAVADAVEARVKREGRSDTIGYAAGLMTWMLAGTVFVAIKAVSGELPPWTLCCIRGAISGLALVPLVGHHWHAMRELLARRWKEAAFIGAIGLGLTQGVMFTALAFTSPINVTIVFMLAPMITMVLARFVLHEALGPWQALGTLIAFAGIVVVAVQGSVAKLMGFQFNVGDLIALGAAVMFAGYTVLLKRAKFELPPLPLLVILLSAGSLAAAPFAIYEYLSGGHDDLGMRGIAALLYCGVIGGALMYLLYNTSVEILGASRAGTLTYSQMVFVAFFAWLILGEAIEWYHYVGAGLVLVGVLFVTLLRPKPHAAPG